MTQAGNGRPKAETYKSMSQPMQALIVRAVENACDFVSDMMIESDDVLATPVAAVYDQAIEFLCQELDPNGVANVELPEATKTAIKEVIMLTVGFSINKRYLASLTA